MSISHQEHIILRQEHETHYQSILKDYDMIATTQDSESVRSILLSLCRKTVEEMMARYTLSQQAYTTIQQQWTQSQKQQEYMLTLKEQLITIESETRSLSAQYDDSVMQLKTL
jgi:hypothetical protein